VLTSAEVDAVTVSEEVLVNDSVLVNVVGKSVGIDTGTGADVVVVDGASPDVAIVVVVFPDVAVVVAATTFIIADDDDVATVAGAVIGVVVVVGVVLGAVVLVVVVGSVVGSVVVFVVDVDVVPHALEIVVEHPQKLQFGDVEEFYETTGKNTITLQTNNCTKQLLPN
jgi:hypothetical protein